MHKVELILASSSPFRSAMLSAAGVEVRVVPPDVDEMTERRLMSDRVPAPDPAQIAIELAVLKARNVSRQFPDSLVIGADQVLSIDGEIFAKPDSIAAARHQLLQLRGKTHTLPTAVVLAFGDAVVWQHLSAPALTMRPYTEHFLDYYLKKQGQQVTSTVGAYQIEGLGAQLFDHIEGDYFTIVGLPLLPLLEQLRRHTHLQV